MQRRLALVLIGFIGLGVAAAQQPGKDKDKDKPPALPPINPGAAKLDITITGLNGPGWDIAASNDLIVAACDGGILAWKKDLVEAARKGPVKGELLQGHQGPVMALAWNGGPVLASFGADKKLILWKMPEGKPLHTASLPHLQRALAMSPDGKLVASAGEDMVVQLWDTAAGKPIAQLKDHGDWIISLAFSGDSKLLASGDLTGRVLVWEAPGGKKVADLPAKPNPPPKTPPEPIAAQALLFAPDGKSIYVGGSNGPIQQLNLGDGKAIRALAGHTAPVTGMALHPTGNLLLSTSKDRTVKLWNPANGQLVKNLEGHGAWVEDVAYVDQFTKAATVSADQTVRVWDFAEPVKK